MQLIINSVASDKLFSINGNKGSVELAQHLHLYNPQVYGNDIIYDIYIDLSDIFSIENFYKRDQEYVRITLGKLGSIELSNSDYRDMNIL